MWICFCFFRKLNVISYIKYTKWSDNKAEKNKPVYTLYIYLLFGIFFIYLAYAALCVDISSQFSTESWIFVAWFLLFSVSKRAFQFIWMRWEQKREPLDTLRYEMVSTELMPFFAKYRR